VQTLCTLLFGVIFACLAGMAHLIARQERRSRGIDTPARRCREAGSAGAPSPG
jgi:hypothetical protein